MHLCIYQWAELNAFQLTVCIPTGEGVRAPDSNNFWMLSVVGGVQEQAVACCKKFQPPFPCSLHYPKAQPASRSAKVSGPGQNCECVKVLNMLITQQLVLKFEKLSLEGFG